MSNQIESNVDTTFPSPTENQSEPDTPRSTEANEDKQPFAYPSSEAVVVQRNTDNTIEEVSIYDVFTSLKRKFILSIVAVTAFLLPFCDTVYLPSLNAIRKDLQTTDTLVALTVSIYLIMNGVFSLFWGPISDRFGRKIPLVIGLIVLMASSIVCIFSPNIIVLLVFRILQGASVTATLVIGQATISDIYPKNERALATGLFFVPFLLGPVIGPLIGGVLSEALGWRSTFVLLSCLSFVTLIVVSVLLPETHQYFVKIKYEKKNANKRINDIKYDGKPTIKEPWKPLKFIFDLTILPYITVTTTTFTALFVTLTLFPNHLEKDPYNYQETLIGVLFIPGGVAMLIGSVIGGRLSDKVGECLKNDQFPESRLIPPLFLAFLIPIGLIIYGWTFHYNVMVVGPIFGQIAITFSRASLLPGIFAYLTIKKQNDAAAVVSTNTFLNFIGAGVGVATAIPIQNVLRIGPFFSLHCGLNMASILIAIIVVVVKMKQAKQVKP